MPRLSNKGFISRAPQTGAAVQELPDFDPQLAEIPGGQETNASLQRWWDLIRQRIEFNNGSVDDRFSEFTRTIDGITGRITVEETITSRMKDYLESRYTINVAAGAVLTGITIFSETGPDTDVSYIAFQADRFFINTSSAGNKQIFSASATEVKFGDVLTVNLTAQRLYMGTGTYGNANTPFYVDPVAGGRMSLGSKFTWDGSTLTLTGTITATAGNIGGWTIGPTTLTGGDATLNSAGILVLGTSNNVVYLSAVDATYRLWVGNATAASATFAVTKTGGIFATAGTIGGWTLSSTTLSASNVAISSAGTIALGTSNDILIMSAADGTYRIWAGNATAGSASFSVTKAGYLFSNSGMIGGFGIGATALSAGSGVNFISMSSDSAEGFLIGNASGAYARLAVNSSRPLLRMDNSGGAQVVVLAVSSSTAGGELFLHDSSGTLNILCDGQTGIIQANGRFGVGAGSTGAPAFYFLGDTDTGWRLNAAGDMRAVTSSNDRFVIRDAAVVLLVPLKYDTNKVAITTEVLASYVTAQDAAGATIKLAIVA